MRVMNVLMMVIFAAILATQSGAAESRVKIRAGIIGCDTSHVVAFTEILRDPKATGELADMKIVAAYPGGSPDIPSSQKHLKEYTDRLRGMDVEIVDSIDELLKRVDAVLLESIDGRPHLAQARPVIAAGKPLFIDKPMAASLADAMEIFRLAREKNVPCFSASSVRFSSGYQAVRNGTAALGQVRSCTAWSPTELEPHHPDLFWYGIHGVEGLFTIMGPGCKSVTRAAPERVVGVWKDGRQGIYLAKKDIGARVEGTQGSGDVGKFEGYRPLVVEIVKFFRSGSPPVSAEETLEILAFMEAADESKRAGGAPVTIESVMARAARRPGEAAREALARMVEAGQHAELKMALSNLRSDPIVEEGEDRISIGKWHVDLREHRFVVTVVAGPIFAEYSGIFRAGERGQWRAEITEKKHN